MSTDLLVVGITLFSAVAVIDVIYLGYHHWNGRGRFTADTLYHRRRARFGFVGLSISGFCVVVLALLLSLNR